MVFLHMPPEGKLTIGVHHLTLHTLAEPKVNGTAEAGYHLLSETFPEAQRKRLSLLCPLTQVAQCFFSDTVWGLWGTDSDPLEPGSVPDPLRRLSILEG